MRILRRILLWLGIFGLDPYRAVLTIRALPCYLRDRARFRAQARSAAAPFAWGLGNPCLADRSAAGGVARGHYFHQDLLVARRIHERAPRIHVDVGSRIDGFVAHVASFRPIRIIDIRPVEERVPNMEFVVADMTKPLGPEWAACCDSLSCLHALEHFGLGRYGDPISHDGYLAGLDNLGRLLATGGILYLSVPIGPQRVEFNAHRVFALEYLYSLFKGRFGVERFSYVDDRGDLHEDVTLTRDLVAASCGCRFGCGIFELRKI